MYVLIINPVAGNGKGKRVFEKLTRTGTYQRLQTKSYITKYSGHAEEIAAGLASSKFIKCIIVIGGDGTLHEVINGLGESRFPISFIPGGSGNDFARGSGIKESPEKILKRIIQGKNKINYWTGYYTTDSEAKQEFVNSMGFGFDAEIAKQAQQPEFKRSLKRLFLNKLNYVIALLRVLFRFKPFSIDLDIEGKSHVISDCWMVTIANHPFYGGGMKIIPVAQITSGELDVLVLRGISKWKVLIFFLTIFTGKHVHFKEISLMKGTHITIRSQDKLYFHADGESGCCMKAVIGKNAGSYDVHGVCPSKKSD